MSSSSSRASDSSPSPEPAEPALCETRLVINDEPLQKKRGKLPKPATDLLKDWIHRHVKHPYPTEEEKKELCAATGLSMSQLCNWMINARRRILPPLQRSRKDSSNACAELSHTPCGPPTSFHDSSVTSLLHHASLFNDDSDFLQLLSLSPIPAQPARVESYCQVLRSQLRYGARTSPSFSKTVDLNPGVSTHLDLTLGRNACPTADHRLPFGSMLAAERAAYGRDPADGFEFGWGFH